MKTIPHGIAGACFCGIFMALTVYFSFSLISSLSILKLICIALAIPMLYLVLIADKLNRIIPDQFSIYILIVGVLMLVSDYTDGTIWFSAGAPWFAPLINRIGAALIGGGVLWLIGFISESFLGREGMGQGDMRLLAACGMMTGLYGLVVVIYVAAIVAVFFAIPLLIRKNIRLSKEEKLIMSSKNPAEKRREIEQARERIHFADDPDYLAFGPFLALGTAVFIVAEPFIFEKCAELLLLMGVYF